MCEWGTDTIVTITRRVAVDACIAEEVERLNEQGVRTESSCCGHGKPDVPATIAIRAADKTRARELGYEPFYPKSTEQGVDPKQVGIAAIVPKSACEQRR